MPSSFIAAISQISIHAPARGGDEITTRLDDILGISIHAPREGGDRCDNATRNRRLISIHAPREGGDFGNRVCSVERMDNFNPRPPRGGRPVVIDADNNSVVFQSTPPARGATLPDIVDKEVVDDISIHAPREGGDPADPL